MKTIISLVILNFLCWNLSFCLSAEEAAPVERPPAVAELIRDLGSTELSVQYRARAILSGMGEEAGPPLLAALKDAEGDAAVGLIELLAQIRYREAVEKVEKIFSGTESVPLKLQAAQALCRFDHNYSRYQSYILSQARSGKGDDPLLAMQLLGYIGDRRVVAPLAAIFNDTAQPDQIRQAAIWDLAHTPDREAAEALVEMLDNAQIEWFYKEIVIAALRRLAGQEGMAPIVSELLEKSQRFPGQ